MAKAVSQQQIRDFIAQITPVAQQVGAQYGIDPNVIVAQAALESGYGTSAPGNNYFGVKGKGQVVPTKEQGANGLYSTSDSFKTYNSMEDGVNSWAQMIARNWPGVIGASPQDAFTALQTTGRYGHYASDSAYLQKINGALNAVQEANGGPIPSLPPMNIPEVASAYADTSIPVPRADPRNSALDAIQNIGVPVPLASQGASPFGNAADSIAFSGEIAPGVPTLNATGDVTRQSGIIPAMDAGRNPLTGQIQPYAGDLNILAAMGNGATTTPDVTASGMLGLGGTGSGSLSLVPAPLADPRQTPVIPLDSPDGYYRPTSLPVPTQDAQQTVTINGHTYPVGVAIPGPNGYDYFASANGTISKLPHVSIGANTIASGSLTPVVQNLLGSASSAVPTMASQAGGLLSGLIGNIWGKPSTGLSISGGGSALGSGGASGGGALDNILSYTTPFGGPYNFIDANAGHPDVLGDRSQDLNNTLSWMDAAGGLIPTSVGQSYGPAGGYYSTPTASSVPQSYGPAGGAYSTPYLTQDNTPAATVPETISKQISVANPAYTTWQQANQAYLKDQNSAIYGVEGVDSPVLNADGSVSLPSSYVGAPNPGKAPSKYIVKTIQVANPDYTAPPLADSTFGGMTDPDSLGYKIWQGLGNTPLGHIASFMSGGNASGGLLSMLRPNYSTPAQIQSLYASLTPTQIGNSNPGALAALAAGQLGYTPAGGSTLLPTTTVNGTYRNTYGDTRMASPTNSVGGGYAPISTDNAGAR